jgi:hypothetical protein
VSWRISILFSVLLPSHILISAFCACGSLSPYTEEDRNLDDRSFSTLNRDHPTRNYLISCLGSVCPPLLCRFSHFAETELLVRVFVYYLSMEILQFIQFFLLLLPKSGGDHANTYLHIVGYCTQCCTFWVAGCINCTHLGITITTLIGAVLD